MNFLIQNNFELFQLNLNSLIIPIINCDALRDLVAFVEIKKCENTHGGVSLLAACNFTNSKSPPCVFFMFFNCTNVTKSRNTSQLVICASFSAPFSHKTYFTLLSTFWKKIWNTHLFLTLGNQSNIPNLHKLYNHLENSQLASVINHLTGFYVMRKLGLHGLISNTKHP